MVPNMLLIRLMQERLKEEDCIRRVRSRVWSQVAGAGGSGDGALSPDEGGSEVGAACSCPRAEMTCREGCSSEVWQRSDCARGLHLGWRKSNKEVPGEPSGPYRDKLDRHTGPKLCRAGGPGPARAEAELGPSSQSVPCSLTSPLLPDPMTSEGRGSGEALRGGWPPGAGGQGLRDCDLVIHKKKYMFHLHPIYQLLEFVFSIPF